MNSRGTSLLEVMVVVSISTMVLGGALMFASNALFRCQWLASQINVMSQFDRIRLGLVRDVSFADSLEVEGEAGQTLRIRGRMDYSSFRAGDSSRDDASVAASGVTRVLDDDPGMRFTVLYHVATEDDGKTYMLVRNGPAWDLRRMELLDTRPVGVVVARGLSRSSSSPWFALARNGTAVTLCCRYERGELMGVHRGVGVPETYTRSRDFWMVACSRVLPH